MPQAVPCPDCGRGISLDGGLCSQCRTYGGAPNGLRRQRRMERLIREGKAEGSPIEQRPEPSDEKAEWARRWARGEG